MAINNVKIFLDAFKEARETAKKEKGIIKAYNQLVTEPINYNLLREFCRLQVDEKLVIEIINTSGQKIVIRKENENGFKPVYRQQ